MFQSSEDVLKGKTRITDMANVPFAIIPASIPHRPMKSPSHRPYNEASNDCCLVDEDSFNDIVFPVIEAPWERGIVVVNGRKVKAIWWKWLVMVISLY
jgi:hypothetical protein